MTTNRLSILLPLALGCSTPSTSGVGSRPEARSIHLENQAGLECPGGLRAIIASEGELNDEKFRSYVTNLNYDPADCVWGTIDKNSKSDEWDAVGYGWGWVEEISALAGYRVGTELVMAKVPGEQSIMVGLVTYRGGLLGIGLPGVSFTQSLLWGHCKNAVNSYLGWFKTGSMVAMSVNVGTKSALDMDVTGCNSLQSTRGMTSEIIGTSMTYYSKAGRFYKITGPRVEPLIRNLEKRNRQLP